MWTYRIKYAKLGRIRFISHLDVMRAITRAINRAKIPVAYSKGFNPRPKLSMGPPLPLGYESTCELADIALVRMLRPEDLQRSLGATMPRGLELLETTSVTPSSPRLSDASSACYMIELAEGEMADNVGSLVRKFLMKDEALVERVRRDKSSVLDARQFVKDVGVEAEADIQWLRAEISIGGQGTCSASQVAQAVLNLSPERAKCLRIMRTDIRFDGRPLAGEKR
ncbi:MAG: DUF2344 domain-containing protein [Candidatus Hydrogenedentota bacterium]|nr:MAG: DUF2344 domain-containing protein [Candidatus Hydrogenedentota bacterium]